MICYGLREREPDWILSISKQLAAHVWSEWVFGGGARIVMLRQPEQLWDRKLWNHFESVQIALPFIYRMAIPIVDQPNSSIRHHCHISVCVNCHDLVVLAGVELQSKLCLSWKKLTMSTDLTIRFQFLLSLQGLMVSIAIWVHGDHQIGRFASSTDVEE